MILGFKERFKQPILDGTKIHTIREDKANRWKAGRVIQFATGVRTKSYTKFNEGVCEGTQEIEIRWEENVVFPEVYVNGEELNYHDMILLAENDGFNTLTEFCKWFLSDFKGRIIHWTDFIY